MSEDFFEPPPAPAEPPPRPAHPPWFGPPAGILPGVVALELVLARSERAAVCVSRIGAYPTGFEIALLTMAGEDDEALDPGLFGMRRHRMRRRAQAGGSLPDDTLRFGVQFSDGRKATSTAGMGPPHREEPTGPVLSPSGGGGGGGNWRANLWVWPLPPAGALALVCEWPAAGIALTRHDVDAALILEAAARAQLVFEGASGGASGASVTVARASGRAGEGPG